MADSIRKLIRDDLCAALREYTDACSVGVLHDEPGWRKAGYPTVVVHPVDDLPVPPTEGVLAATTRVARFAIEAWVRISEGGEAAHPPDPGLALADEVEAFLAVVVKAVLRDPSRSGRAIDTRVMGCDFLLMTREERLGGFELIVECDWRSQFGDITVPL
jgi:hypothetical protein